MSLATRIVRAVLFLPPPPPVVPPARFDPKLSEEVTRTTQQLHDHRGLIHKTMAAVRAAADEQARLNDAVLGRNRWP